MKYLRKHQVSINLDNLYDNAVYLQQLLKPAKVCAVLKNNAYGHGVLQCARTLYQAGIRDFSVVDNDEIRIIREQRQFDDARIWRIRPAFPDEISECQQNNWRVIEQFGSKNDIEIINKYHNPVCLTLDISMGREGFVVPDDLPELQELLSQHTDINIVGVMAQLANANDPDLQITASEIDVFSATCEQLAPFIQGAEIHIANSATCLRLPKKSKVFSMVRLGASLYGESTSDNVPMPVSLNYCFSWKTYVSQVRKLPPNKGIGYDSSYRTSEPTIIATLPIGYADGLPKTLGNSGEVLIHGQRCPIVGGISSAMATVDVTAVGAVNRGDEVVIIGTQGEAETTPDQLAKAANTGHLAVQTAITAPRMYMFSR